MRSYDPIANGPHLSNTKFAAVCALALLIVHDVSVVGKSSVGCGVRAYAGPPSHVARSPKGRGICSKRRHLDKLTCELRRDGARSNDAWLPRNTGSTFMTNSWTGTEVKKTAKYQLVWSPNFWKKMAISTALWLTAQYILKKNASSLENMLFPHDLQACHGQHITKFNGFLGFFRTSFILPLLSSSCCAIQLITNALSGWGCAGFNRYLDSMTGPIRPLLLPLLLLSTWNLLPQRPLGWTFLSLFLAFLPELVDIRNANRSQQWQRNLVNENNYLESTKVPSPLPVAAKLRLDIPTMGCVARDNKIDASVCQCKSTDRIIEATSYLTEGSTKGGMVELSISARSEEEINTIVEEVVSAINNAGFQCNVDSLRVDTK